VTAVLRPLIARGLAGLALGTAPLAQAEWFTLNDATDKPGEVVQVDPTSLTVDGYTRTIHLRLDRDTPRRAAVGVMFRSFEGTVSIDCLSRTSYYDSYTFYPQSNFRGEPVLARQFGPTETRLPAMVGLRPEVAGRVIRAACRAEPPQSRAASPNAGG